MAKTKAMISVRVKLEDEVKNYSHEVLYDDSAGEYEIRAEIDDQVYDQVVARVMQWNWVFDR